MKPGARRSGGTSSGTVPYSTDEVPFSATPRTGSTASPAVNGSGSNARMPAAVRLSVRKTVGMTPIREPSIAAHELARGTAREDERECDADRWQIGDSRFQQEWQEGEKTHAGCAVNDADQQQHWEAPPRSIAEGHAARPVPRVFGRRHRVR